VSIGQSVSEAGWVDAPAARVFGLVARFALGAGFGAESGATAFGLVARCSATMPRLRSRWATSIQPASRIQAASAF